MFDGFKRDYNRQYDSEEAEAKAFKAFVENIKIVDERNMLERQNNGTALHGITRFSDIPQEEFVKRYLNADISKKSNSAPVMADLPAPQANLGLVDWTGKYTTAVKDQGYCGSCWAFSATEQIESDSIRVLKKSVILSPAQITQCDTTSKGCNGGWTENAYNYVKKAGGLETEANYPYSTALYQGKTGTCVTPTASKLVVTVSGYTTIKGEANMASYVQSTGPLSVCVDANNWNSYKSGIMTTCGKSVDHCVQAVGVDASSGGYWKVRNSWATSWGESGHIRLAYGANTCAITNDPTWASVVAK